MKENFLPVLPEIRREPFVHEKHAYPEFAREIEQLPTREQVNERIRSLPDREIALAKYVEDLIFFLNRKIYEKIKLVKVKPVIHKDPTRERSDKDMDFIPCNLIVDPSRIDNLGASIGIRLKKHVLALRQIVDDIYYTPAEIELSKEDREKYFLFPYTYDGCVIRVNQIIEVLLNDFGIDFDRKPPQVQSVNDKHNNEREFGTENDGS